MGLHIRLEVQVHHVDPEAWQRTFNESIVLLQRFPAPLLRFEAGKIGGFYRYQTTTEILCSRGSEQEHWRISGDQRSGCRAESFELYRYLHRYLSGPSARSFNWRSRDVDVLWTNDENVTSPTGDGHELFGNKTQGYPYHYALLAVGILFENRFPGRCFVHGDFDRESAQNVLTWVNSVLGVDFDIPVCLDSERLYTRLAGLFEDQQLLIGRFKGLFMGPQQEAMHTLVKCSDPDELKKYLLHQLGHYSSVSQPRVYRMLSAYFKETLAIDSLIDLVLSTPEFKAELNESLETLLEIVCRHVITIDGTPTENQLCIDSALILEKFAQLKPEMRLNFEHIISKQKTVWMGTFSRHDTLLHEKELDRKNIQEKVLFRNENHLYQGDSYLIDQIETYRKAAKLDCPEIIAEALGYYVSEALTVLQSKFKMADLEYFRKLIIKGAQQNTIVLSRKTWESIDREEDIKLVKALALLILLNERNFYFSRWRIYLLEQKNLWPYFFKSANVGHSH
jgi:hypothetical protein